MSGYCPAGKVECDCYVKPGTCVDDKSNFYWINGFEVCPWPSRQQVEPPTDPCSTCTCIDHADSFAAGYAACKVDAERNIINLANDDNPSAQDLISIGSALTAIRSLVPRA